MTPEQCAYLSTLSYTKILHNNPKQDTTLGGLLFDRNGNIKSDVLNDVQTGYSPEQWETFLNNVKNDPDLSNLTIVNVTENSVDKGSMITFKNPSTREAVITYQGTAGPEGWDEDFKSGYKPITDSQQKAIDYANEMTKELDGYYVYSTGHSKGANEAALVAVECDGIDSAVAFDAPGNGEAYFDDPAHAARARDNSYKVTYYSNENCFVSGMNTRYDATEHWLKSDYDEWTGMEGLKGILEFSPMAHSTLFLFDSGVLEHGDGFSPIDNPSAHVTEINNFTRWLEENLPPEDCQYLLDAVGMLVAQATSGEDIIEILKNLDPKTLGILLATLQEYPRTDQLLDSLVDDGWLDTVFDRYGLDAAKAMALVTAVFGALPGLGCFVGLLALMGLLLGKGYLDLVVGYSEWCKLKMRAQRAWEEARRKAVEGISALLHTHDFSDRALSVLEGLVRSFKNSPIRSLYEAWKKVYGALAFFTHLDLRFLSNTIDSVVGLLDGAIDTLMAKVRENFHRAWELDSSAGSDVTDCCEEMEGAIITLRKVLG